jgi:hypothetical protein
MISILFSLFSLSFDPPVQFIVDKEEFVQNRMLISRDVRGFITVSKDSVYLKLDTTYASFYTFKYNSTRKHVTASFKKDKTYGDLYGINKVVYINLHNPKYGNIQVKYKVKHTTLED